MKFFKKLTKAIKIAFSEEPTPEKTADLLECKLEGSIKKVKPISAKGFLLVISTEEGMRLISESHAINQVEFWRFWNGLNDEVYVWEDGTPFSPVS